VFHFLDDVLADAQGAGLLHGPSFAGKSDLMEQIAVKVNERAAVAVVDGARLKPTMFLTTTLTQFGYELGLCSSDELLSMLNVFAVQQSRTREAPVLIVENFNQMFPSTLDILCKLATLRINDRYALRIVLVGEGDCRQVIDSSRMAPLASRLLGEFEFEPLTARESLVYLHARLQALGIEHPDAVFKTDVFRALHDETQGWPGKLDLIAAVVAGLSAEFPVDWARVLSGVAMQVAAKDACPQMLMSLNGELVARVRLVRDRYLIGRSGLSDIVVPDRYVSKHHALLVMAEAGLILVDMKSRNGTLVNSRKIQSRVLRNDDVVSIGHHRMKIILPSGYVAGVADDPTDTATMKNIPGVSPDHRRASEVATPEEDRHKA